MNGSKKIKVAFLLLCHGSVEVIKDLLNLDYFDNDQVHVYIHYDLKSTKSNVALLKEYLSDFPHFHFVEKRVVCKWGMYSLVRATLNMMEEAVNNTAFKPDYIYLMSAACTPIKPFHNLQEFLSVNSGKEFIQAYDVRYERWVTQGWDKERYQYYFPFCWYGQRKRFEWSCRFQERFKLNNRKTPIRMNMYFGSQWFCLSLNTCKKILEAMENKELEKFFRLSWIPDEFAIQSLTVLLAGYENVTNKNLTFYQFNSFGRPLVMYDDHQEYVKYLPYFFARKISSEAKKLKSWLSKYTSSSNKEAKNPSFKEFGIVPKDLEIHQNLYTHFSKLSKLGKIRDKWGDGMEHNNKKFYVLTGPCKYIIKEMTKRARDITSSLFYDYVFEKGALNPTDEHEIYGGISKNDIKRRDYDRVGFLYQIIHAQEKAVLFCLDPDDDHDHIREVVRWSYDATVVIVEPHWRNELERNISYISELEAKTLLKLNNKDAETSLFEIVSKKDRYYWPEKIHEGRNCTVSWLEDSDTDYSKLLKKIKQKLPLKDYLTESHLLLIKKLTGKDYLRKQKKIIQRKQTDKII